MKKTIAILAVAAFAIAFSSCKKEYECCYYDSAGVKLTTGGFVCTTTKMSKKDKEDVEASATASVSILGYSYQCN